MAQQPEPPSTVSGWAYPFALKAATGTAANAAPANAGPDTYLAALATADDGFYPLGANGLWHGGIHFGAQTAGKFDQDGGVKCIADGEVVAFRLASKLQELAYPDGSKAGYSHGFTLVRHRLVLPPAPAARPAGGGAPATAPATTPAPAPAPASTPAPGAAPAAAPADADALTFFSLYMHTLPFDGYDAKPPAHGPAKTLPAYYGASEVRSVGTGASDPRLTTAGANHADNTALGLRVRASASGHANVVGWLARGTQIKVGQTHGQWGRIDSFVSGSLQSYEEDKPAPAAGTAGWVYLAELDKQQLPPTVDQVYVLPKPHKIAAGETVAFLGEYQRLVEARAHHTLPPKLGERPLLHVEVFTGDDLNAFITRSRARAQQFDPKARRLLLISKGAKLVQPAAADTSIAAGTAVKATADSPAAGPWAKVTPVNAAGHPVAGQAALWIARTDLQASGARPAWSHFPLNLQAAGGNPAGWTRVVYTAAAQSCVEAENKTWYAVSIGDEHDTQVDGWACDHGHPQVELKSSWDWPGFDVVSLDASVSDMFQRALFIADSGTPDELASFEDSFNSSRSDATIKQLEDAIDGQQQKDGKISAHELQLALGKPWLADRIDHLVVRYESEWGGEMSKWDALDSHMHAGLPVWQAEKKRIDALRFWSGVSSVGKFPASATVYHLHPLGLVGNFLNPGTCECGCCLDKKVQVVRWNGHYGPCYWGTMTLANAPALQAMLASGEMTASEQRIIAAMAPNEGKLDTVQSYDDQVVTAGAMQKTMRPDNSKGELAKQIADFRAENETAYQELFARCGWAVEGTGDDATLSFTHPDVTSGRVMTGTDLRDQIRKGCNENTNHQYLPNPAVAALAHAISDLRYQKLQITDFVKRLRKDLSTKPTGYNYTIGEYLQGDVGRAAVLDQSVNRPAFVSDDLGASLDRLYAAHPTASRNPNEWGASRATLESALSDNYGQTRRMAVSNHESVAPARYNALKAALQ
ncbi:hypothetical protein Bpla01_25110 [Burkholderia plantarii]|nr:phage lysozyme [Burkholderia plantarii]GLZ18981.1 hypothetical protein Bpla01_25110 [Burkholderia plantarii]